MKSAFLLACLFPAACLAQTPSGTYLGAPWQINDHHALVWAGQPYMPVGLRIDGTPADVDRANASGARDMIVNLAAGGTGWSDVFSDLNKSQDRFLIQINSLAPMAKGVAVEPQGYRVPNLTGAKHIEFKIPDASSALVLLVNQEDATIVKHERVPIINGLFTYDAPDVNGMDHVLLVYPETTSLEQPDFWDGFDAQRDQLLISLRRNSPGPGLRGIVNPLGRLMRMPAHDSRFVPTSAYFRDELRSLLESRYHSVETATKAWTIAAPDFQDFDTLCRMVPLWSGYRGVPSLWDPASDRLYDVDNKRSTAWNDINDAIQLAATRRFKSLVADIRQITNVPVIQEWAGWAPPYDGAQIAIDGVGVRSVGSTPTTQIDSSCRAVSSLLRWQRPGWLIATDVHLGDTKGNMNLDEAVAQLANMGVRACFSSAAATTKSLDSNYANTSPSVLYFPENATNPAVAQRLPGGMWWLPSPASGDRIDLGSKFAAYRLEDPSGSFTALWSPSGPQKTVLRFADLKTPTFETIDGSNPNVKAVKNGIEITVSDVPLLIKNTKEIPVPDPAPEETISQFTSMLRALGYERGAISEEQYYFTEAAKGFARNPGASLLAMRLVLRATLMKVANYTWVEAESAKSHNFSTISSEAGCSGRSALILDTEVTPDGGFFASYDLPVRTPEEQELWIAARIPEAARDDVTVVLAGKSYKIPADSVSAYGDGYAWYNLGSTKLGGKTTTLKILVNSKERADLGIDTILIYPGTFRPNGVQMPAVPTVAVDQATKDQYAPEPP